MRRIHVHALVAQTGSAKSVNKDKLLHAATREMINITIIISLSLSVLVYFQVFARNYKGSVNPCRLEYSIIINININITIVIVIDIVIVIAIVVVITIIISVRIFPSISQELQGKCKPLMFGAQQQSITNYIPPVECIFYSLPCFWIRCFSCYGKVVRILQCDFVQASISLNKKKTINRCQSHNAARLGNLIPGDEYIGGLSLFAAGLCTYTLAEKVIFSFRFSSFPFFTKANTSKFYQEYGRRKITFSH